jgi:hypothetical protein
MELKEYLTNEKITKKFSSQFELVNYAIKLAENMMLTGREARVKTNTQNRSLQVLGEILNNKDRFDEIIVEGDGEIAEYIPQPPPQRKVEPEDVPVKKPAEKKRTRKALAG